MLVREVEVETATAEEAATPAAEENTAGAEPSAAPAPASVVLSLEPPAATAARPAAAKSAPRPSAATPIVWKPLSKFTVTVEYVELVPVGTPAGDAPAASAPTS